MLANLYQWFYLFFPYYRTRPLARVQTSVSAVPQIVDVNNRTRLECRLNNQPMSWWGITYNYVPSWGDCFNSAAGSDAWYLLTLGWYIIISCIYTGTRRFVDPLPFSCVCINQRERGERERETRADSVLYLWFLWLIWCSFTVTACVTYSGTGLTDTLCKFVCQPL